MKNNALQIFAILLVILVIILGVVLIMFYNGDADRTAKMNDAVNRASEAEKRERDAKMQLITLKQLIGHKDETDIQAIQQAFESDMMRYAKTVEATEKNYRASLANIFAELGQKNEEHKNLQASMLDLQTNFDNLNAMYDTVMKKYAADKAQAIKDLTKARSDFDETLTKERENVAVVTAEKQKTEQEAEAKVKDANTKAEAEEMKARQYAARNAEVTGVLDELRKTNFERPDGEIMSVNQQSGQVIINLGSDDGLQTRMTFSVYDPSITGISFGNADPDKESVICEVCKREMSRNVNKASIEVVKILGPHKAEARILDDQLTSPIVAGDVIYTPIWKPGQHQHFALASGMRIPGLGRRDGDPTQSDLTEILRLIRANGGIVDCYISEGNEEGKKRGDLVGAINRDTTFLVMGDMNDEDNQDQVVMEAQSQMKKTAEQYAVKVINLRELLSRMGWKNVTPVRGFGNFAAETDYSIKATGEHRPSTGLVTPLYQHRNEDARISNKDRGAKPSTGQVTGLYTDAPSTARSPGKTSDLFRPRKPGTGQVDGETKE